MIQTKPELAPTFEVVLDRHQREIYLYLCRMTGQPADAEDLLQETVLRAYRSFGRLRADSNYRAWLYKIATNTFLNFVRKRQREPVAELDELQLAALPDQREGADDELGRKRLAREVSAFIAALPLKQRVALIQRKYEGLSYPEIAANLKCSEEAARANVFQAIKKIKGQFDEQRPQTV